ncbi:glycosyltransferase [Paratractidigestivibacter sp.]|uniref:glycosyltransferase n=1 Tax=Paratractidigestivibacter sp. TaxID=2847316 RepID=UPI002AC8DE49|nr:glycosyltransferase [Paratractidigestivibacter sp.]
MIAPYVSVIMGVYRCKNASMLRTSVESIIAQSFQDWEFLIVDDGSDDDGATYAAIQAAASLDDRVVPLRYERNRGLAYALNFCLERARGCYIARQDDDDTSMPERLEREVAFLDARPDVAIVGTNAELFDESGAWGVLERPERPMAESFLWNSPFIHPSVVMRADPLRSVGGYRVAPETLLYEDYDLFMRMYAAGMCGCNMPERLYSYRSDRHASKPRPMDARLREAKIRAIGFRELGLGAKKYFYIAKPVLLGLVPNALYGAIQGRRTSC